MPSGARGAPWGSLAYTFSDSLYLVQVTSLFGWTALTFCVAWVAAVVNWAWDGRWSLKEVGTGVTFTVTVLALVVGFGVVRVCFLNQAEQRTRVACVVAPATFDGPYFNELWAYTRGVEQSDDAVERAREQIEASRRAHFELVEREAAAGADLVVWAEANAVMTEAEEPEWMRRASEVARRDRVYVGMGLSVFRPSTRERTENKFILVGPDGERVWEFLKATRVPGSGNATGDGKLPTVDTELGRLTPAICFDLDFPQVIRQAGRSRSDVLIAPSNDWTEARATHARMATLRAVENGTCLVRPTKDSISITTDSLGRTLSRLDTETSSRDVSVAVVPARGRWTLYSVVGDILPWMSLAFLGLVPLWLRLDRQRRVSTEQ